MDRNQTDPTFSPENQQLKSNISNTYDTGLVIIDQLTTNQKLKCSPVVAIQQVQFKSHDPPLVDTGPKHLTSCRTNQLLNQSPQTLLTRKPNLPSPATIQNNHNLNHMVLNQSAQAKASNSGRSIKQLVNQQLNNNQKPENSHDMISYRTNIT